jgi:hypothetical protein
VTLLACSKRGRIVKVPRFDIMNWTVNAAES